MDVRFKLHHVGIAVAGLGQATERLCSLFGYSVASGPFDDPLQRVSVTFLSTASDDPAQLELIAPFGENSPIASMLERGTGGAYHLCLETADLDRALDHVQRHGCLVVSKPAPAVAFQGRRIAWIYTPERQLIELLEQVSVR